MKSTIEGMEEREKVTFFSEYMTDVKKAFSSSKKGQKDEESPDTIPIDKNFNGSAI